MRKIRGKARCLVEADLGTLEVTEATAVERTATTAATATAVTKATATAATSTTTTTVAEATTASTAAAAEAAAATATTATEATATAASVAVVTGSSEVETDGTASNLGTVEGLESGAGLLCRGEVDVTEALEGTSLTVGGKRDTGDVTVLLERLLDSLVCAVEGQVTKEQSVAGSRALVTELVGTVESLVGRLLTGSGEVNVERAAIKLVSHHLLLSLSSGISRLELDVTEALGATSLAVANDTAAGNGTELLELAVEPVLINVPAQAANEEVLDTLTTSGGSILSLGLLDGRGGSLLSLALLGRGLLVAVGGVGVG